MAPAPNYTPDTETQTWLFRVGMGVIGFFLALGVRDAKRSLDDVPTLKAQMQTLLAANEAIFRRLERLEERELRK